MLDRLSRQISIIAGLRKGAMEDLNAKRRIYSNQEMTAIGADGHYPHAIRVSVPIAQIGGLEPVPAASDDEGYRPGRQIKVPVEVEYSPDIEPGKNFALSGGNHRLHQANINGQTHIEAFVHHPEGKYVMLRARLKGWDRHS